MPENSPRMKKFQVKGSTIKNLVIAVASFFAALVFTAIVVTLYIGHLPSHDQLEALKTTNTQLNNAYTMATQKLAVIEHRLSQVENLEIQLRRLTQVNDPSRHLAMGPVSEQEFLASLGSSSDAGRFNQALTLKLEETLGVTNPKDVMGRLDELVGDTKDTELKLAELSAYIREQKFVLTHTPSVWPARGWLTSGFGSRVNPFTHTEQFHEGIDISNDVGAPIIAPADGIVVQIIEKDGYGRVLVIDHGMGIQTVYAHVSQFFISLGENVVRGQKIAAVGNTGRSTGPHLHYEVRIHGIARNPLHYILE